MNANDLIGTEIRNESKNMSLGVVTAVRGDRVVTVDVSGKQISRPIDTVETTLRTSSAEAVEPTFEVEL